MKRRVVITGIGVISPNGIGKKNFWDAIVNGKSAVERITAFDVSQFNSQVASEVKGFNPRAFNLREDQIRRMDRYVQFAVAGAKMAVSDAGIDFASEDRERIGVCMANAICGTKYMEEEFIVVTQWGKEPINPEYVSPYLYDASVFNTPSNEIAAEYNLMGGCYALSTGCTAGTDSIIHAYKSIARGETDVMIAGASEAPITPIALAAFDVINALAKRNHDPSGASRPFDRGRNGFVLGEGCGVLILEDIEHAKKRGARIYTEIGGTGSTSNAYHMTDLPSDGIAQARCIDIALNNAQINIDDVSYINAHGSSTEQNDLFETNSFKRVFKDRAYKIPISSIKSMIGHPLSAANSIELAASCLIMESNCMPPTINYEEPDPACDLDYIPNKYREGKVDVIVKTSSGFSGIHSAVVLRRVR